MEPGGTPYNDATKNAQRKAASDIARRKVLAAYQKDAENSYNDHLDNTGTLKTEKISPILDSESFKKYHSAWQNYYQKYYSEYYSTAAKNYVEKERLKDARDKNEEEEIFKDTQKKSSSKSASTANQETTFKSSFKQKIRKKATENAKKTRRYRRLIPILAGVFVVLLILFLQYNRLIFAPIMAYISPTSDSDISSIETIDPTVTTTVSSDPRLIIPKINVDTPVSFGISLSEVTDAMTTGVAHFRVKGASSYPGEQGNVVISGHSSGDIYNPTPYSFIFSGLERLSADDLIYINYNSVRYTYKITKTAVVEPTDVAALTEEFDKPMLILVTCTPLGTARYRLLVFAEQISPSVENNTAETVTTETETTDEVLPSNEPSFFERIWNWLTGQS